MGQIKVAGLTIEAAKTRIKHAGSQICQNQSPGKNLMRSGGPTIPAVKANIIRGF